jgi:hypothetical protein
MPQMLAAQTGPGRTGARPQWSTQTTSCGRASRPWLWTGWERPSGRAHIGSAPGLGVALGVAVARCEGVAVRRRPRWLRVRVAVSAVGGGGGGCGLGGRVWPWAGARCGRGGWPCRRWAGVCGGDGAVSWPCWRSARVPVWLWFGCLSVGGLRWSWFYATPTVGWGVAQVRRGLGRGGGNAAGRWMVD